MPTKGGTRPRPSQANTDNGGHGDIGLLNGSTGNAPSGGRTNNSAMDNAGAAASSGGFNNIAGNAGGAAFQSRLSPRMPTTASAPPKSASGGEGGAYKVNGSTGNAPTTGPGLGSKLNTAATAKQPSLPRTAPADTGPVDFGACPGCGNNGAFRAPR